MSTINLNSTVYSCFNHFPSPSKTIETPSFEEVKQSSNIPFQALFHACRVRGKLNNFQTYSHNWSHQDSNRPVLSSTQSNTAEVCLQ